MAAASSRISFGCGRMAVVLLALLPANLAPAGDTAATAEQDLEQQKLEQVREEIDKLKKSLEKARTEQSTLLGDLQRLDMELALHRRQKALLDAELQRCRRESAEATAQVNGLQGRLEVGRRALGARLRALYISGPPAFERVVLAARNPADVIEAYRVASLLARSDSARIEAFRSDLAALHDALVKLEARRAELTTLRRQEAMRRADLEKVRSERSRLLVGVEREMEEKQGTLKEMSETERALHRLVKALAAGEYVPEEWRVGFDKFRGLLPWPVPGKVLVPFGARRNSRFNTRVPHPGIEVSVVVGQPIHAVFDGLVAFSDWFKGYGNLVIVEHGRGFMTIYGHASERLVSAGEKVLAGQAIARGGDTGSLEGPRLYFEIWHNGRPEDPLAWLARR